MFPHMDKPVQFDQNSGAVHMQQPTMLKAALYIFHAFT